MPPKLAGLLGGYRMSFPGAARHGNAVDPGIFNQISDISSKRLLHDIVLIVKRRGHREV